MRTSSTSEFYHARVITMCRTAKPDDWHFRLQDFLNLASSSLTNYVVHIPLFSFFCFSVIYYTMPSSSAAKLNLKHSSTAPTSVTSQNAGTIRCNPPAYYTSAKKQRNFLQGNKTLLLQVRRRIIGTAKWQWESTIMEGKRTLLGNSYLPAMVIVNSITNKL